MLLLEPKVAQNTPKNLVGETKTPAKDQKGFSFVDLLKGIEITNKTLSVEEKLNSKEQEVPKEHISAPEKQAVIQKEMQALLNTGGGSELELLDPKILKLLDKTELHQLILKAKNYLKDQIQQTPEYKKAEIKELPKTLASLLEVAKKFGIEVKNISVTIEQKGQQDQSSVKNIVIKQISDIKTHIDDKEVKPNTPIGLREQKQSDLKTVLHNVETKTRTVLEQKSDTPDPKAKQVNEAIVITKERKSSLNEQKAEAKTAHEAFVPLKKQVLKQDTSQQTSKQINTKAEEAIQDLDQQAHKANNKELQQSTKAEEQKTKSFALFKEAVTKTATTEQFVQLRQPQTQETNKQTKEKTQDTLALLLRGNSTERSQTILTSDFSVETAKVIVPEIRPSSQTTQTALESLLRSEGSQTQENLSVEEKSISKTELGVSTKSESLELKISEAKQMIKYLSSDVKTAIDEYRSPFSRIKLQLNPQKLGELDLTIVQRGNNLHVNMSANNAAINTLALHANELRTQLTNNGINNASLHFSSNTDGGNSQDSNAQQQQQQQNSRGHKEYSYVANEETNEELANSLEIVVPRYI